MQKLQAVEKRLENELEKTQEGNVNVTIDKEKSETTENKETGARPKVKQLHGNEKIRDANLLTFSRQKLALIQSEYDLKHCSCCRKCSPSLKTCVKCKTATYCSKECQEEDWKIKHRAHCKEIRRLTVLVDVESEGTTSEKHDDRLASVHPTTEQHEDFRDAQSLKEQKTARDEASLLTFSRQKLALLQCEYNPKCCSYCGQGMDVLKTCSRCKTAKYCSQKCQEKDWPRKHKQHCKEMRRLAEVIEKESEASNVINVKISPSQKTLKALPCGKPWFLRESYKVYGRMCIYGTKLIFCGTDTDVFSSFIDIYNVDTHKREASSCFIRPGDIVSGLCIVKMEGVPYIAISTENSFEFLRQHRFELWSFPSSKPYYSYTTNPNTFTVIHSFDGTLLIANELEKTIHEFNVRSTPFKSTGLTIPTGFSMLYCVQSMCVLKEADEKRLVIQYVGGGNDSEIKCLDYRGRQLWKMSDSPLDGRSFQPLGICTDGNGNIFSSEQDSNRVVVIKEDLSLQTLIHAPGKVWCVTWCDVTNRLYVLHSNERQTRMVISEFQIAEK